ncbi:hypothetical protein [Flavobacterium notoginsengisoli]|uniref:hypothetical protein n=1 Tax=Flavobacterium notoginsengisoli TaxID=1478199 RepID=UPI00363BB9CE
MNIEQLVKYISQNNYNLDFETDGIGMTWGVSYVRLTIGLKSKFENIEHFFFSTLNSDQNMTSGPLGGPIWSERTDLKEWANNLKISEVKKEVIVQFIEASKTEIQENLKYWIVENTLEAIFLDTSKEYEECLLINETLSPRHYINTTDIYLATDKYNYYLFEGHYES